eukprot:scaffold234652_cov32-Tisochrysis_lutea.AAC.3
MPLCARLTSTHKQQQKRKEAAITITALGKVGMHAPPWETKSSKSTSHAAHYTWTGRRGLCRPSPPSTTRQCAKTRHRSTTSARGMAE